MTRHRPSLGLMWRFTILAPPPSMTRGMACRSKPDSMTAGEQPLGIQPALFVHDAAHLVRQAAGLARQHLLDLGIGERKSGFLTDSFPDLVNAADHSQFQTVCRFRCRQGVVDPHQIHRPAADVHEQQRRFVGQQIRRAIRAAKPWENSCTSAMVMLYSTPSSRTGPAGKDEADSCGTSAYPGHSWSAADLPRFEWHSVGGPWLRISWR